nr:hypothetical protein [Caldanaerobius polysaccharolyticus]
MFKVLKGFKFYFMIAAVFIFAFVPTTLYWGMSGQRYSNGGSAQNTVLKEVVNKMPEMKRQMENLDRGLIAVKIDNGVYIGWRLLGTDPDSISFNIYRDGKKINSSPIGTSTNYLDPDGNLNSIYYIRAVVDGKELPPSEKVKVWSTNYLSIPLQKPADGITPDGVSYTYSANDASVGDLDGDGQYEVVLKWDPSNSKDNAQNGYTGNVYIDAYKLNGKLMWRIDLGKNIRAGAHYTQFMVYDLDGDGRAEIACKTADGTVDGIGKVIGDPNADYRNAQVEYFQALNTLLYLTERQVKRW